MAKAELYRLNKAEEDIFAQADSNPNLFTNWYFKSKKSGTYATHDHTDERYQLLYKALMKRWLRLDKPRQFDFAYSTDEVPLAPFTAVTGQVFMRGLVIPTVSSAVYTILNRFQKMPTFHINHGFWMQDWQLDLMALPQDSVVLIGGYGCIAPQTEIWDVELGRGVAVEELYRQQRSPVVLAWDGNHFVPTRASVPWIKGKADLYEVTTESGRKIITTLQHRFLTVNGWMTLQQMLSSASVPQILTSSDNPLESNQDISPLVLRQDVQHYSHTAQDSQFDCLKYYRYRDGQLQSEVNSDQDALPLQGDAASHNQLWLHRDVQGKECKHSPLDASYLRRHSMNHSALPSARPVLKPEYCGYEGTSVIVPLIALLQEYQALTEYDDNSRLDWQSRVFDLHIADTDCVNEVASTSPFAVEPKPPTIIESILSIRKVGYGEFYDLHVPVYENYLAEGFINHNSSKTSIAAIDMMIKAATLPGFAGFIIAPGSIAAGAVFHDKWMGYMEGTLYEQRFFQRRKQNPPQEITLGNEYVGLTDVKFFSVHDDQDKIKNIEGDMAHIDQAEQLMDISTMKGNTSSRLRGNFQGRARLGKTYWIANPNDNPDLWNLADDSLENPQFTYYKQVSSYDNWALTEKELRRFERDVGATEDERNSNLFGFRPVGGGKEFSKESIKNCIDEHMNEQLKEAVEANRQGYMKEEAPRLGLWRYEMPYEEEHKYMIVADPGQDNPPERNAACIGAWDVTEFPEIPARLVAFHWVFGNGSPLPWMQSFYDLTKKFHAHGMCGYDSTGWQSGYQTWVEIFEQLQSRPLKMDGNSKFFLLNSARIVMNKGMLRFPNIPSMTSQLARYEIPDTKLRQDIVAMIMLTCGWLQELFYLNLRDDDSAVKMSPNRDRYEWRKSNRRATRAR